MILQILVAVFATATATATPTAHAAPTAAATTIDVAADQGKVQFHAVGRPSMIKINGEGKGPNGKLSVDGNKITGDLTVDLKTLSSGIDMRDEHMKDKYLEVGKYPTATLHLTQVTLPEKWTAQSPETKDGKFKGDLTLHGVTKPIDGTFEISGQPGDLGAKAAFTVDISQFNVTIPSYLGITVKNEVPVELTMSHLKAK